VANLASALMLQGRLEESRRYRLKTLDLFRAGGASYLEGVALGNLGVVERRLGLLESASTRFQQARDVLRRAGRPIEQAVFDAIFGHLLLLLGFVDAAATNARQSVETLTRLGTPLWRERYVGLLEVRIAVTRMLGGSTEAYREAMDRGRQLREYAEQHPGALGQALTAVTDLLAEAEKPVPRIFRGHLPGELEPHLCLALLDRAESVEPEFWQELQRRPQLLAEMREKCAGLAVPDWQAEIAPG